MQRPFIDAPASGRRCPRVVVEVEAKKELTGMDRMDKIKADSSPFLYPDNLCPSLFEYSSH
jgi:hypothetical protein